MSFAASSTALARRAQFGMLRHIGMLRSQVLALLAGEGILTSMFGVFYGLLLGGALSLVLVFVVNRQSFRWSIDLAVPYRQLGVIGLVSCAPPRPDRAVERARGDERRTRSAPCGRTGEARRAHRCWVLPGSAAAARRPRRRRRSPPGLAFPADYGSHPEYRTEWWYVTGWLETPGGESLGFQVTFFRTRPGLAEDNPSAFAPRQLIIAHAALSDPEHGQPVPGSAHPARRFCAGRCRRRRYPCVGRPVEPAARGGRLSGEHRRRGFRAGAATGRNAGAAAERRGRPQPQGTSRGRGQLVLQHSAPAGQRLDHPRRPPWAGARRSLARP